MKKVSEYLPKQGVILTFPTKPKPPEPTVEQLQHAASVVNKIFAELQVCCPAWHLTFTSQELIDVAKKTWMHELVRQGITSIEQIEWGLQQARTQTSRYWPSLGEFISWCLPDPQALGLPSYAAAYEEACRLSHPTGRNGAWSHDAVYAAAISAGLTKIYAEPENVMRPTFVRAYGITLQKILRGEPIAKAPRPARLPAPTKSDREKGNAFLRKIRMGRGITT